MVQEVGSKYSYPTSYQRPPPPFSYHPLPQPPMLYSPNRDPDSTTLYSYEPSSTRQDPDAATLWDHEGLSMSSPQAGPSRSRGIDYLRSLQSGMASLTMGASSRDGYQVSSPSFRQPSKPLPAPPIPSDSLLEVHYRSPGHQPAYPSDRPASLPKYPYPNPSSSIATPQRQQPASRPQTEAYIRSSLPVLSTPPKSFRPSHLINTPTFPPASPHRLAPPSPRNRPRSDPTMSSSPHHRKKAVDVVDLTYSPSSSDSDLPATITKRSPARRQRATSEQPLRKSTASNASPARAGTPGKAVQCAGYTRTGDRCKRLVRSQAPYLLARDLNAENPRLVGRYCKDHAGMICKVDGFYFRGEDDQQRVWVEFEGMRRLGHS